MGSSISSITLDKVKYRCMNFLRKTKHNKSLEVIGLDTEAYTSGVCFMLATSLSDVFQPYEVPACFFTRKYRGKNLVCYNLKYDSGALLQCLTPDQLKELQQNDEVKHGQYTFKVIANKCLSIRKGKNTVHIYDILNFYNMGLERAAQKFLGKGKINIATKRFTKRYVKDNWKSLSEYCIKDAVLVKELTDVLIAMFESFGVYPQKLYSVAYVSYQYFTSKCAHIHVKRFWDKYKPLLDYAMRSYNGGKFEVTVKGTGYLYEYDIVSAYPFEIANLVDIRDARVIKSHQYRNDALYGFLKCNIKIPYNVSSPVALKRGVVNIYPIGEYQKVITKVEYDYLIKYGCDITILKAYWLVKQSITYPYKYEVEKLMKLKNEFKRIGQAMKYHTVKIFLNSFYGKFVQLIEKDGTYKAGGSWNPIYGSIITSNCRVKISEVQQLNKSVIAVHTDSVISTKPLKYPVSGILGNLIFETEGNGVVLGSGIYQVGTKSKIRGFDTHSNLLKMLPDKGKTMDISKVRPYTWREIAHRNMEFDRINRFENMERYLRVNFDSKRIWLNDYKTFKEVRKRNVESVPWIVDKTDI